MTDPASSFSQASKSFAAVAVIWAAGGALICWAASPESAMRGNLAWFLGLWALSVFNILALGKTVKEVLGLASAVTAAERENRLGRAIRAFSWGTLKLICLGIFIVILLHRNGSVMGQLLGAGTLVVVPLVGGLGAVRYA